MKCLVLCLISLLCGCSKAIVRCDAHLQPIIPIRRPASPLRIPQPLRQGEDLDGGRRNRCLFPRGGILGCRSRCAAGPQRPRGVVVAAAGWSCAVASAMALVVLMPLKRVDPFVIRVDNSTGIVDIVPVYAGQATPEEAVTRYFLTHYVAVCERFNFSTAESDYEECGAFHSRSAIRRGTRCGLQPTPRRRSTCTRTAAPSQCK